MRILTFSAPEISKNRPEIFRSMQLGLHQGAQKIGHSAKITPDSTEIMEGSWDDFLRSISENSNSMDVIVMGLPGRFIEQWDSARPFGLAKMVATAVAYAKKTPVFAYVSDLNAAGAEKLRLMGIRAVAKLGDEALFSEITTYISTKYSSAALATMFKETAEEKPEVAGITRKLKKEYNYSANTLAYYARIDSAKARKYNEDVALACGDISYDLENGFMRLGDKEAKLRKSEVALLRLLLREPEESVTLDELLDALYGDEDRTMEQKGASLRVCVHNFRAKLASLLPDYIDAKDVLVLERDADGHSGKYKHAAISCYIAMPEAASQPIRALI